MKTKLMLAVLWGAVVGCMIGTPVHAAEKPASALIVASDLLKLKQLESPALSPDGRSVVYVVRSIEPKPDAKDEWVYHQ
ncbi:MAG: hypothetical protein CK538_10755, partial [Opitutia bacterium]